MDLIKLNTAIEEMEEYEPLPAGLYTAELRDLEVRHSEKQPNGFFYAQLRIDPQDYPADYDAANAPEGVTVVYARVQMPDANNRRTVKPFKNFLKAMGVTTAGDTFDPQDWIGRSLQVLLSVNDYQGSPVNNVEAVQAIPST